MKGSSALTLAILIFFAFGCMCSGSGNLNSNQNAPSPSPSPTHFIDSLKLVNKSAKEIDAILGKPVEVTKITNDPDDMPGEFRDYKLPGSIVRVTTAGVMVRFYRDKAVHFTIELPREYDTPVEALKSAGIDVNDTAPRVKAPMAQRWAGVFNGVSFKDVAALSVRTKGKYGTVQVEVYR